MNSKAPVLAIAATFAGIAAVSHFVVPERVPEPKAASSIVPVVRNEPPQVTLGAKPAPTAALEDIEQEVRRLNAGTHAEAKADHEAFANAGWKRTSAPEPDRQLVESDPSLARTRDMKARVQ